MLAPNLSMQQNITEQDIQKINDNHWQKKREDK